MRRLARLCAFVASLLVVSSWLPAPQAQDSPILAAMRDELKRSMAELRLKDEPAPYYIDYEVTDVSTLRVVARLGSVLDETVGHNRTLQVDVRVGDYAFDSSRFVIQNRPGGNGSAIAPLDDDYDAMRRQIWLATDTAYTRAVSVFARKKAAFQNRVGVEQIPDLSRETPVETVRGATGTGASRGTWVQRTQQLSAVFASSAALETSDVWAAETRGMRYYVNSEGFTTIAPVQLANLRVTAEAQADDGMMVRDGFNLVETRLEDLPPMPELIARTREVADRVTAQRLAPVGDEFTGPVLLEGQASAEFVAETLVPLMLARRPADSDNPRFAQAQGTPFLRRIGLRVLSDAFSISDTPSLSEYGGRPVPGAYQVDDEGVQPRDVNLVDKGRLLTLLTSRTPQKNLLQSNGHNRTGVQAGVIQMQSAQAVPASELKSKYLDLLRAQDKTFGYIVRGIANPNEIAVGSGPGGPFILQAIKVTLDGKEQSVRGLRFGAVTPAAFRDLAEASQERTLYSYRGGAAVAVSVIVPNLMFEELEIQRVTDVLQKPPIVPSPPRE
jgi:microcin-processing metallopeptidase PmbA/TldD-like protein